MGSRVTLGYTWSLIFITLLTEGKGTGVDRVHECREVTEGWALHKGRKSWGLVGPGRGWRMRDG